MPLRVRWKVLAASTFIRNEGIEVFNIFNRICSYLNVEWKMIEQFQV